MHEISIAESIVEIAEVKAREQHAVCVQVIKLRLGVFTTIVPEALQFAFEIARQGTRCDHALLEIELVPMIVRCVVCQQPTQPVRGVCLLCAACGFPMEIVSGEELQIEYIDVAAKEEELTWSRPQDASLSKPMC